jgi:hypothetical protein
MIDVHSVSVDEPGTPDRRTRQVAGSPYDSTAIPET